MTKTSISYPLSPDIGWGRLLWIFYDKYNNFWKLCLCTKIIHRYLEFTKYSSYDKVNTKNKIDICIDNLNVWWLRLGLYQITIGIWGVPKFRRLTI